MRSFWMMLFLWLGWNASSQADPVLMRINGKEVLRSEFEHSYRKARATSASEPIAPEKYVERFVDFKLKAAAAEAAGLDTLLALREGVESYRKRLAESYLTDSAAAEDAARQLYDKMKAARRVGQVRVSHIFTYLPQTVSARALREAVARMDSIYEYLRENPADEAFAACVERYSDEKDTFWVSWLQMPVEFEEVVFELPVGEISRPFFTPQGIHIVKVVDRKEMPPFEEVRDEIKARLSHRHEPGRGVETKVEELKKEYQYAPDKAGVNELVKSGRTHRTLFTLAGRSYTGSDFARFAAACPAGVRRQLDAFVMKSVLDYENARLERKYPDFRWAVQAYRERLLSDKITEEEVGRRAETDDAGLKSYFEKHRSRYQWKEPRYKGAVLHGVSKRVVKKARKFLQGLPEEEWKDAVRLTFNAGAQPQIRLEQGVFAPGDNAYVDEQIFKGREAAPVASFPFTVVLGKKVKGPEEHQEVKERLVADYRDYLASRWTARLRASAKVEIDREVLKTVNNH